MVLGELQFVIQPQRQLALSRQRPVWSQCVRVSILGLEMQILGTTTAIDSNIAGQPLTQRTRKGQLFCIGSLSLIPVT